MKWSGSGVGKKMVAGWQRESVIASVAGNVQLRKNRFLTIFELEK